MRKWIPATAAVFLGLLLLCFYMRWILRWPYATTAGTFCVLCLLALAANRERLMVRFAPRFTAAQRLNRFLHSGKKIRVVCFGRPEEGEAPGFHLVFDGVPQQDSGLTALLFSEIEPRSLAEKASVFLGKTADAYCYLNGQTGVQLTGTLEAGDDGFRLSIRGVKLSGRAKEIPIRPRDRIFSVIVDFL